MDFPNLSAEYWLEVDNARPILCVALSHVPDAEPVDVPDLDQTCLSLSFSLFPRNRIVFERHEELRRWIRERPSTPFIAWGATGGPASSDNPLQLYVELKFKCPRGEVSLYPRPREGFGAEFENAFRDGRQWWKVAVGPGRERAWALQFGVFSDTPLFFSIDPTPSLFRVPLFSPKPWTWNKVPIHDFREGIGIDFLSPPTRELPFVLVDPVGWIVQFLRDFRSIPDACLTNRTRIALSRIEQNLAFRLVAIHGRQKFTDPTEPRRRMLAAIRSDPSFYASLAVVQLPVSVNTGDLHGVMQLEGTVDENAPSGVTLSEGVLPIQPETSLVFAVRTADSATPATLDAHFHAKRLNLFQGPAVTFEVPNDQLLRMPIAKGIEVPATRLTKTPPTLQVQQWWHWVLSPKTVDELLDKWEYRCLIKHEQSLDDTTVFDFCEHTDDAAGLPPTRPVNEALFFALAQHVVTFETLRSRISEWKVIEALEGTAERLLATLNATPETSPAPRGTFAFTMRNEDIDGIGHVRIVPSRDGMPIPYVQVPGLSEQKTDTPGLYWYRTPSGAALTTEELLRRPDRDVRILLNLLSLPPNRDLWMKVDPNGALSLDGESQPFRLAGEWKYFRMVNPAREYHTPIAIGGARRPLAEHLRAAFLGAFKLPFHVVCLFADGGTEVTCAAAENPRPGDGAASFIDDICAYVGLWLRVNQPAAGTLIFDLKLFYQEQRPIHVRLELPLSDVER